MSPPPSILYATISAPLPSKPYILSINPSPTNPHLILRHPGSDLTIVDNQTLQPIDQLTGGHQGNVTAVATDQDALWSSAKDGSIIRWDERSKRAGTVIRANIRKPIPVTALTISERDHLVIGGTELLSSESHIIYWDNRNSNKPIYLHSSTHSDDITHLSILPNTSSFLNSKTSSSTSSSGLNFTEKLLLSSSTDGLIALSNPKESDEDESIITAENWNQSIADSKFYLHKGKMKISSKSDMDLISTWDIGLSNQGEIELQNQIEYPSSSFRFKSFKPPKQGPTITQTASEEMESKTQLKSDYLIDVVPSLGISKNGGSMTAVGTNDGDLILQHHTNSTNYQPSSFFLSGPSKSRGHKDVIRSIYHDLNNEAIYTGSEDGIISGWSLNSLSDKLIIGDDEFDLSGDEDENMDDDQSDEESEILTEEEESDKSDNDMNEYDKEGPRYGPILGAGAGRSQDQRKEKRKENRFGPY